MKTVVIAILLFLAPSVFAQREFNLDGASKNFDLRVNVENCEGLFCSGRATIAFYKKGRTKPYQVINLPDTRIELGGDGKPMANVSTRYGRQSFVNFGDFNFDGNEDIALCDGANGSYGAPSYRVYLFSKAAGRFVLDKAFTELGRHWGMFEVDAKKKRLTTFDRSPCCYITDEFTVFRNIPVKVRSVEKQLDPTNDARIMITTKTLVRGTWKTSVKFANNNLSEVSSQS